MYFEKEGFIIAVICSGLWYEEQADEITLDNNSDGLAVVIKKYL